MKFKKSFLVMLASAAMLVPSHAALSQEANGGGATIRYQAYDSTGDMLFRVMEAKFCKVYGLQCQAVRIANGPLGIQSLLGTSLEVSYITTDAGIRAITGGADVRIAMGLANRVPFYVAARRDVARPNKDKGYPALMRDFKGKRIGVTARGSGTELIFNLLLRDAGMSPSDVTYIAVGGPPTAYGSMSAKQIDATVMVPPLAEICDSSPVCETVLNLPAESDIKPISALAGTGVVAIMRRDYIEKNPQVFRAFLAAAKAANKWMKNPANFEEYFAIAKKNIRVNVENGDEVLRTALKRQLQISDTGIRLAAIQAYVDLMHDAGLLEKKMAPDQIVSDKAPIQ